MSESTMLLLRMAGSLVVVIFVLWVLVKLARSRGLGGPDQELIDIRAQRGLNRSTSLMVVQVGSRNLLLGVADGGVRVLSEGDDLVAAPPPDATQGAIESRANGSINMSTLSPAQPPSRGMLNRLRDRTVRRQR